MANLAIKCHATRGKEVIEILEMLGGKKNVANYYVINTKSFYFLNNNIICSSYGSGKLLDIDCYTLEEFLEKFPYKIGDKVEYNHWPCVIQEMCWDNEFKEIRYVVKGIDFCKYCSVSDLKPCKEESMEKANTSIYGL